MPRSRARILNIVGIALLALAAVLSDRGGNWTYVFPAVLVVIAAGALLYQRLRRQQSDPPSGRFSSLPYRYPWRWALVWGAITIPVLLAVGAEWWLATLIGLINFVVFGNVRSRRVRRRPPGSDPGTKSVTTL